MHAYAAVAPVSADFVDHDWAKDNLKESGKGDDFSTVWLGRGDTYRISDYDTAIYFYGGRNAIYAALEAYEYARIQNFVDGHRSDLIHVFSGTVKVGGGKRKQIIMLAIADRARLDSLDAFRDRELEEQDTLYRMREFRGRMRSKWPDIGTA